MKYKFIMSEDNIEHAIVAVCLLILLIMIMSIGNPGDSGTASPAHYDKPSPKTSQQASQDYLQGYRDGMLTALEGLNKKSLVPLAEQMLERNNFNSILQAEDPSSEEAQDVIY